MAAPGHSPDMEAAAERPLAVDAPAGDRTEAVPDLAALFREYAPFVWRTLRRLGLSAADADDATQEVFLVVNRKLAGFEGRSSLRTWLYGISVRTAFSSRRRARSAPTPEPESEASSAPGPEEQVALAEARVMLDQALTRLDPDKRAVFVLYEIERLSMAEISEALDCPLQTAYSRLHAARARVTEVVAKLAKVEGSGP
jgi:RNA polymerase sigma-70 factor (ECF subfamily)